MEIEKIKMIFDQTLLEIGANPKKTFEWFTKQWDMLSKEDQNILKPFLAREFSTFFTANLLSIETQMYCAALVNFMDEEGKEDQPSLHLALTNNIKDNQLAKLFYDLKTHNYINNTNHEIANVLSKVFNLNYNTVFSYLSDPSRLETSKPLF